MPKLAVPKTEMQNRILRGSLKNARELKDMDVPRLSALTGIAKSTLYLRLKHPETFTVRELRLVMEVLKVPEEERSRIGREAI